MCYSKDMSDKFPSGHAVSFFCSLTAFALARILKDILFLTMNSLVYLYEGLDALSLYSCSCLMYASLRLLERKRAVRFRFLFAKTFAPSFLYGVMVVLGFDFNLMSITASVLCLALCVAGISCVLLSFTGWDKGQAGNAAVQASVPGIFSAREKEVAALIMQGKTAQEAADVLFISLATVKTHIQHIYEKAGVHNRAGLCAWAQDHPFG